MKAFVALALLLGLRVDACSSDRLTRPVERPTAMPVTAMPELATNSDPLAAASTLVAQKNWPQALAALESIIDSKTFRGLPPDVQYRALATAGAVAGYHGPPKLAYEYLGRAVAFPQADSGVWLERLRMAGKLGHNADAVGALTVVMRRWPDRGATLNADYVH